MHFNPHLAHACALALVLPAALFDARRGVIPNWLTLPTLALAPLVRCAIDGPGALGTALLGAASCALVPLALFQLRAMGGGDVKLFAALGTLHGASAGLELELWSFVLCAGYGVVRALVRRELCAVLLASFALFSRARRTPPDALDAHGVRLAPLIAIASLLHALGGAIS